MPVRLGDKIKQIGSGTYALVEIEDLDPTIGAVADGQLLKRSGSEVVGAADQLHAQSHTHGSHTGIGADDHHAQAHKAAHAAAGGDALFLPVQYVWGNDEAEAGDITVGAISRILSVGGTDEPCTRIVVHALTTPAAANNLVFNIEQSSAEDLNGATWANLKTVTFTATGADPDTHIDTAPAITFTARRALRINVTTAPAGWKDVTILLEAKRALVS